MMIDALVSAALRPVTAYITDKLTPLGKYSGSIIEETALENHINDIS